MGIRGGDATLRRVQTLWRFGTIGALSDGQLLERFADAKGEQAELAFETLIERHGPVVLRVCHAVLTNRADAEDAFQATFLVLARKAGSLSVSETIGPWLHAVALRTALDLRSSARRRRRLELRSIEVRGDRVSVADPEPAGDLSGILHEEIGRLPERFRLPIVICDLEGRAHAEAARNLGWPLGTLKSRLSRARLRLRERLTRRGLAPPTGVFAGIAADSLESFVPESLIRSTLTNLPQCATGPVPAVVAQLATGVLFTMLSSKLKLAAGLLAAAVVGLAIGALSFGLGGPSARTSATNGAADPIVHTVDRGPIRPIVDAHGRVEAASNLTVVNETEGERTILSILPEGTAVKLGDLVAELDSASLRNDLVDRQIVAEKARVQLEMAKKTLEVAELGVKSYVEGEYPDQLAAAEAEIRQAEAAAEQANLRVGDPDQARRKLAEIQESKRNVRDLTELIQLNEAEGRLIQAGLDRLRAQVQFEQAGRKLQVLQKYTHAVKLTELESAAALAKSQELKAAIELETASEGVDRVRHQIEKTKLYAPADGFVLHANDWDRPGVLRIEEGKTVHRRQKIFQIPDLSTFQVRAKVSESRIESLKSGMRAEIVVDALPGRKLVGEVGQVAAMPDPAAALGEPRRYSLTVLLEDPPPGLRPGMTAAVGVQVAEIPDAIRVPVRAVLRRDEGVQVALRNDRGAFDWRPVQVGLSDGVLYEVLGGLEPGDVVALDPADFMTDRE